ncbi:MAG: N-acetyltransferase family protein [Alphaproteobacteria bacterium]
MSPDITIRPLAAADAAGFRALRMEALELHPDAFGASPADEAAIGDDVVAERLARGDTFGAFAGGDLVGMAGFFVQAGEKRRHRGTLWGMYVRPAWRGRGIAGRLVDRVLAHAAGRVELVQLSVTAGNGGARRLYESRGFVAYGVEARALKLPTGHVDEVLMARMLVP